MATDLVLINGRISIVETWGGVRDGLCLQITAQHNRVLNPESKSEYAREGAVQLTREEAKEVVKALQAWLWGNPEPVKNLTNTTPSLGKELKRAQEPEDRYDPPSPSVPRPIEAPQWRSVLLTPAVLIHTCVGCGKETRRQPLGLDGSTETPTEHRVPNGYCNLCLRNMITRPLEIGLGGPETFTSNGADDRSLRIGKHHGP